MQDNLEFVSSERSIFFVPLQQYRSLCFQETVRDGSFLLPLHMLNQKHGKELNPPRRLVLQNNSC